MSGMINYLATYFGSTKEAAAASPQQQQDALIELFTKEAEVAGYDLEKMSQQQIRALYDQFLKLAEEAGDKEHKEDDDEEKKRKAEAELEEKKASAEKRAEADEMGRIMARSYVDELQKIAAGGGAVDAVKGYANKALDAGKGALNKYVSVAKGEGVDKAKSLADKAQKRLESAARKGATGDVQRSVRQGVADKTRRAVHMERGKQVAALAAPVAAAAGGAALAARNKESSALDELAMEEAVVKAASAGFDLDQAAERVAAVATLGLGESEKIASQALQLSNEQAIDIRALEFLEAAGYPVTWNQ